MYKAKAYSAASAKPPLGSPTIARRDPTEHDIQIEMRYLPSALSSDAARRAIRSARGATGVRGRRGLRSGVPFRAVWRIGEWNTV